MGSLNHDSITGVFSPVSLEELPSSFIRVLLGALALSLKGSWRIRRLHLWVRVKVSTHSTNAKLLLIASQCFFYSNYTLFESKSNVTARKRIRGKVMFLHLSVSHSVHMGGACVVGWPAWQGVCVAGGHVWQGVHGRGGWCMEGGHVWQGGGVRAGDTATEAGGMHPTKMHFCSLYVWI